MRLIRTMILAGACVGLVGAAAIAAGGSGSASGSAAGSGSAKAAGGGAAAGSAAGSAKAAGSGAAAGSAAGSGSAAAAGMTMPKPPQELTDMAKNMGGGAWKCSGKVHMPSGAIDVTANITGKLDVDKMYWHESLVQTKSKGQPYKFEAYMTYDAMAKKWMRVSIDNMGVIESTTSTDRTTWTGTASGMGQTMQVKTNVTPGDKEIKLEAQMSMDGKQWMPSFEMDCKK
jgi:hypothetical protein